MTAHADFIAAFAGTQRNTGKGTNDKLVKYL